MLNEPSVFQRRIFREIKHYFETGEILDPPTVEERVAAAIQHLSHSMEWKGERLGVLEMRRHYTNYFRGFRNIKPVRMQLVQEDDPKNLIEILNGITRMYS